MRQAVVVLGKWNSSRNSGRRFSVNDDNESVLDPTFDPWRAARSPTITTPAEWRFWRIGEARRYVYKMCIILHERLHRAGDL